MTDGEMKKVSAWIPQETLTKLEEKGYQNRAEAIRLGLECLLKESTGNPLESNQENKRISLESTGNPLESTQEDKRNPLESTGNPLESTQEDKRNPLESIGIQYDILKAKNEEHQRDMAGYKENIKALNIEIARLKEALSNAPDPGELIEARTRSEGLQRLTEEKERTIDILNREVETLNVFAHYFKNVEIKQIEAPAAERKRPWYKFW